MAVMLANAAMPSRSPCCLNNSFRKLHAWSSGKQGLSGNALGAITRSAAPKRAAQGELHAFGLLGDEDDPGECSSTHFDANSPTHTSLSSSWMRSERRRESNNQRTESFGSSRAGFRPNFGARGDGGGRGLGFRGGNAGGMDVWGEQRRAAFENWARQKFREEGQPALSVIEEMRQAFAPGAPRPGASNSVESCRNQGGDNNHRFNRVSGRSSSFRSPVSDVRKAGISSYASGGSSSRSRVDRGSSPTGGFGSRDRSRHRSSTMSEAWSPKSATSRKRGVQLSAEGSGKASGEESTSSAGRSDAPSPQPLLVKRRTKFPVNFYGRAGTVMLVDKPQGWTSFAVCAKLRYLLKIQKVGHAGTLDPMATGLLIVCLGKATKLADSYQALTKVYSGTIRLGELTPSLDAFTEVSDVLPWEHITDEQLEQARQEFVGDIFQTPPMYSAIKVAGERLYLKARRGEQIEVPPRLITIIDFQLERSSENRQDVHFKVTCSKGTYVRSLCADLAQAVGSYAHLTSLRREKIGTYSVKDAWPILDFVEQYSQTSEKLEISSKTCAYPVQ